MGFRDVKRLAPKAPKSREVFVRFRVSEEEYADIQEAAEFEGARFEIELVERGLPKSVVQALKRPSEWMRYVVMKAATPLAEEARRQRAQEAERREREAREARARAVREAERSLGGLFIADARSAVDMFRIDPALGSAAGQVAAQLDRRHEVDLAAMKLLGVGRSAIDLLDESDRTVTAALLGSGVRTAAEGSMAARTLRGAEGAGESTAAQMIRNSLDPRKR